MVTNGQSISIGVPVHNEEKTLLRTLESVINSANNLNPPPEIVICFSATTDRSREIAEKFKSSYFPSLRSVESEKGKPQAVRKIVGETSSEFLIFCDGDVIVNSDCFSSLLNNFSTPRVMAVTGCPEPYTSHNLMYNVLNARMLHPESEIARKPLQGNIEKPFIHGRIYALRREVFSDNLNLEKFEQSIGDDTFLTHFIIQKYGRNAVTRERKAIVKYMPVQSLKSWWDKWSRIWSDLEKLYKNNPEFNELRQFMKTKLDWNWVLSQKLPVPAYFIAERIVHHAGKIYFKSTKNQDYAWNRLDDTKRMPQ